MKTITHGPSTKFPGDFSFNNDDDNKPTANDRIRKFSKNGTTQ